MPHFKNKKLRRLAAVLFFCLAACLLFLWVLEIAADAHDCVGAHCLICQQHAASKSLKALLWFACLWALLLMSVTQTQRWMCALHQKCRTQTPVLLKVRMNH